MEFVKYQGTGNDFILIDARHREVQSLDIKALCDRRFGIGADGLMLLKNIAGYDFEMVYYNSDGNLSSMCGNGGRCIAMFAHSLGIGQNNKVDFLAVDGPHSAAIIGAQVELGMKDVSSWEIRDENIYILNTGSPHYIDFTNEDPNNCDLIPYAKAIRYNNEFSKEGINVNLVQQVSSNGLRMRTYERGVEDETFSCGTGVTAAALAFQIQSKKAISVVDVKTKGGDLQVKSNWSQNNGFEDVILCGPAAFVFSGTI
jgi:diaminopimelate epimerase